MSPQMAFLFVVGMFMHVGAAPPSTCGGLKKVWKDNSCCGAAGTKAVTMDACPYNFAKPTCDQAEPQAPRDLSTGATGQKIAKAATLSDAQANSLPQANVHYHLGAEHKSDQYSDGTASAAFDTGGRRLSAGAVRPGWMCPAITTAENVAYTFQYCKGDVAVGKSYEIHYVHSSAGYSATDIANADFDLMDDGLGGAANGRGQLNPLVVVQAQIFQITNDANAPTYADIVHGWDTVTTNTNKVMYAGSTTGPSHSNSVCSPYAITWHVDKNCHKIKASSFDNFCKMMKEQYKLDGDLYPHGSRVLLDPKYVVPANHVQALS